MEIEICSDSADNSSFPIDEAATGRRSQRVRKPSLCSSDDYSTPPKRKKSDPKCVEQSVEEIYKQLGAVKTKSTSLETIYEQPKNFKDPSRNLMAGVKTRRSCVLAEFYNPSKLKLKTRKEKAKRLKRLGVNVPSGDLISEEELQAALSVISEDEDDIGSNKTSHIVNTSLIMVSPKRDVYLPSAEIPMVTGSSFIVPDKSFVEDNLDVSKNLSSEELYKISLSFLDEPSDKVDSERSRSRKSRRSGGLRDFHSSTLSFRKEAAASAAQELINDANSSLAIDPVELLPSFNERISAIVEKEEQDESPIADDDEGKSALQTSARNSCRRSPVDIGLPSSPKDYSKNNVSSSSKSPRRSTGLSPPTQSSVDTKDSPTMNNQTMSRRNSASTCSPKINKSPALLSPSRSKSPAAEDSCISCKSLRKRPKLSPPTRSSRNSKALKRVSSPPPPCPVCTDCSVADTISNQRKEVGTSKGALNNATRSEKTATNTRKAVPSTSTTTSLRCGRKQSISSRAKQSLLKTGASAGSSSVGSKQVNGGVSSRRPTSTSNKEFATKRRVSGVMKTVYSSYLELSSPEEEESKSTNSENDAVNSAENVFVSPSDNDKSNKGDLGDEECMNESRSNFLQNQSKSVTCYVGAAASNVLVEENSSSRKNTRKRKFDDHFPLSPVCSQMSNIGVNDNFPQTPGTANSTPSKVIGCRKTLDPTAISLNTSIPKVNSSPNIASKPTIPSPACLTSQLSLPSPLSQRNRTRNNHRRRSARLQAYTLLPLEGPSKEELMEVELTIPGNRRVLPFTKSAVQNSADVLQKSKEIKIAWQGSVALDDDEADPEIRMKINDEGDEEKEISFKMHNSSGEPEADFMVGGQSPFDSSARMMSPGPVENSAARPTDRNRNTRSALFTKDSSSSVEERIKKDSNKKCTTRMRIKAVPSGNTRRQNEVLPNTSLRSPKKLDSSSTHSLAGPLKPRRISTLKARTVAEVLPSPPATRARAVQKTFAQNPTRTKIGSSATSKSTPTSSIKAKNTFNDNKVIARPVAKVNKSNSSSVETLAVKSLRVKTKLDVQMETTSLMSSESTSSVIAMKETNVYDVLLKESSAADKNETDDKSDASKSEQVDNNNERVKDIEMKINVASIDTSVAANQLDGTESVDSAPAKAFASSELFPSLKLNADEEITCNKTGSKQLSFSAPPSPSTERAKSASLSPPDNQAVLVPAALPSPAETKKAFYLINKYKPKFSLSSHPSLSLNYNDGPTSDNGCSDSSDGNGNGNSIDIKKNTQKRKSSGFATGGGRTCFAVHPALASCTTDVFAGRKMLFVPDKKGDGYQKTLAQEAFVSAVAKKLNDVNLEMKSVSVIKEASGKVADSKVRKTSSSEGVQGRSPKSGKRRKGMMGYSTKGGKSPKGKKGSSPKRGKGIKGLPPRVSKDRKGIKGQSLKDDKGNIPKRGKALIVKSSKGLSLKGNKGSAVKPPPSPPAAAAAASGSCSSNESPKLSRSPFGGKGKTKIMLNDLADQEAIFDAPSPTIERKDYIRTGLGGSTVSSLSSSSLLLKPANAFSPPTLKPSQHIFPPTSPKFFNLARCPTTPPISNTSTTPVTSKLATASLPPPSKLSVTSFIGLKTATVSDSTTTSQIFETDSAVTPASVSIAVTSQSSNALAIVPVVGAPGEQCAPSRSVSVHCPTALEPHTLSPKPLASSLESKTGGSHSGDPPPDLYKHDASNMTVQSNPLDCQLVSGLKQPVQNPSHLGSKAIEHRPGNHYKASASMEGTSSVLNVPLPTTTNLTAAFPVTPPHRQPTAPASIPAPSLTLHPATPAANTLSLNADSPLLSGMFSNAVGVRAGKVFANPQTTVLQKGSEPKKLLPTFTVFPH